MSQTYKELYERMKNVAGELFYLADEYSRHESDTVKELSDQMDAIIDDEPVSPEEEEIYDDDL